eukprot:Skav234872  [mRNA]  locus=scaffold840:343246:346363:- [translate_table: standard]
MSGEVWDVLPHGLRLRKLVPSLESDDCIKSDNQLYFIPNHQIPQNLLDTLSNSLAQPEFKASWLSSQLVRQQVRVKFLASQLPGSDEATGQQRVKAVKLCSEACDSVSSPSAAPEVLSRFPPALPVSCPVMTSAADEWQRRAKTNLEAVKECLEELQQGHEDGKAVGDFSKICEVLCCCIAGVHVILDWYMWSAKFGGRYHPSLTLGHCVELQTALACLLTNCLVHLSSQEFGMVVWKDIKPALSFCCELSPLFLERGWPTAVTNAWRDICQSAARLKKFKAPKKIKFSKLQCSVPGCWKKSRWLVARKDAISGWRCAAHRPKPLCNVMGCTRTRAMRIDQADIYGLAGYRCCVHGARSCSVPGCKRFARCVARSSDQFGSVGRRCWAHCPPSLNRCVVPGCQRVGKALRSADGLGPAGRRCTAHGGGKCRVAGCNKQTWGRVNKADDLGPMGRACWLHGGKVCNIPGCKAQPRGMADSDHLGVAGARCTAHLAKAPQLGPKRCRQPELVVPEASERCHAAGREWRCKRRKMEGAKHCEHHEALYQKRLHRMWLKRAVLEPKATSSLAEEVHRIAGQHSLELSEAWQLSQPPRSEVRQALEMLAQRVSAGQRLRLLCWLVGVDDGDDDG